MAFLYEKSLPKIKTGNISKIIICCGTAYKQKEVSSHYDGFLELNVPFDVQMFLTLDDGQKKVQLLELIHDSLLWVANNFGMDEEPFRIAYQKCIEANYECKVTWKKAKANLNRKYKAIVEIELTLYKAILSFKVINQSKLIIKELVIVEEKPNIALLERFLGDLKWISSDEIHLYPKYFKEGSSNYFHSKFESIKFAICI